MIRTLLTLLLSAVTAAGCSDGWAGQRDLVPMPNYARVATHSPNGVPVGLLVELVDHQPAATAEVLRAIDETPAAVDSRVPQITAAHVGPPPGWSVQVYQAGWFPTSASPTGFASGQADLADRTIHVALSRCSGEAAPEWIPAYDHELAHAWAQALGLDQRVVSCIGHACAVTQ